jgi:hypothetical protein
MEVLAKVSVDLRDQTVRPAFIPTPSQSQPISSNFSYLLLFIDYSSSALSGHPHQPANYAHRSHLDQPRLRTIYP